MNKDVKRAFIYITQYLQEGGGKHEHDKKIYERFKKTQVEFIEIKI